MRRRLSGLIVQRLADLDWVNDPPPDSDELPSRRRASTAITRAGKLESVEQTVVIAQKGSAPGGPLAAGRYRR